LINVEELVVSMPLTIAELARLVSESSSKAVQHLKEVWIPTCAKLISDKREDVEAWMPQDEVCFSPIGNIQLYFSKDQLNFQYLSYRKKDCVAWTVSSIVWRR
jgi:hypothetical protein